MKILVLSNNCSDLYNFRSELISAFIEKGENVVIVVPYGLKFDNLEDMGVRLIDISLERRGMNPIKDFKVFYQYLCLLIKESPDLVITYTIKSNIYGGSACKIKRIPYAVNITGLGTAFNGNGFLRKMVTMMYRFALKKAKAVFFENEANMQIFLNDKIIRKEQAVLLNGAGVNLDRFSALPYPEDTDEFRFLFMGRVMAEKGVNELFEAMRMLRSEGISCSLDMLGSFEENFSEKIKEAEKEGWLRYHGYQEDVRPYIAKCHCFVLPSWHEGMANANLECASSGRPIITSNVPGCKEAVIDGVSGLLCEPKNAQSLYAALKTMTELCNRERESMGLMGRKHMKLIFDKEDVIKKTMEYIGR